MSAIYPNSKLLTTVDDPLTFNEYHTSLGDMAAREISSIAKKFDQVNFVSDGFDTLSVEFNEIFVLLNSLHHTCVVSNFCPNKVTGFTDSHLDLSCSKEPTVWVFGCSHSHGVGLESHDHRYGNIIANSLGLSHRHITKGGSSLWWSLRHLINSEFAPNDIVIWQFTTPGRLSAYINNRPQEIHLNLSQNVRLTEFYTDPQIFFHHFNLINYGVKYLRAKNIKFALTSVLGNDTSYYQYLREYTAYPEYCYSPNAIIDYGADGVHAGPLSHKLLAQDILDRIYYLNDQSI
jgi:hypothetical protein